MKKPKLSDQEKGLLKLKNDPSLFVREVLGAEPELWQTEALKAIRDHDRVLKRGMLDFGKRIPIRRCLSVDEWGAYSIAVTIQKL